MVGGSQIPAGTAPSSESTVLRFTVPYSETGILCRLALVFLLTDGLTMTAAMSHQA
jgi:hypothetical protein